MLAKLAKCNEKGKVIVTSRCKGLAPHHLSADTSKNWRSTQMVWSQSKGASGVKGIEDTRQMHNPITLLCTTPPHHFIPKGTAG